LEPDGQFVDRSLLTVYPRYRVPFLSHHRHAAPDEYLRGGHKEEGRWMNPCLSGIGKGTRLIVQDRLYGILDGD
jgi:hypothetical protein